MKNILFMKTAKRLWLLALLSQLLSILAIGFLVAIAFGFLGTTP